MAYCFLHVMLEAPVGEPATTCPAGCAHTMDPSNDTLSRVEAATWVGGGECARQRQNGPGCVKGVSEVTDGESVKIMLLTPKGSDLAVRPALPS
jgi:hypothetical protein